MHEEEQISEVDEENEPLTAAQLDEIAAYMAILFREYDAIEEASA